ncbi:hypothetical protein [Isoptericola aurantiacus]|uniref:hypothetical protein n=1 Tax=Isoptericola aurantiacus TaxID=3377839 RepID=UPI00383A9438
MHRSSRRTTGRAAVGHVVAHATGAALLVNAVPHTVHALSGRPFPTPFADPPGEGDSTPAANVLWGGINAVAGASLLLGVGRFRCGRDLDTAVTSAAALLAAYGISRHFSGVRARRDAAVAPAPVTSVP